MGNRRFDESAELTLITDEAKYFWVGNRMQVMDRDVDEILDLGGWDSVFHNDIFEAYRECTFRLGRALEELASQS